MLIRRVLLILVASCLLAAPAHAQNGVTVDPGSPSGKEYAIPLDAARRDAAPRASAAPSDGGQPAPLFGEGVGDSGAASEAGTRPRRASGSTSQPKSTSKASKTPSPKPLDTSVTGIKRTAAAVPAGGSSLLTIGAVALSVLLLGGVIGSIARRRGA